MDSHILHDMVDRFIAAEGSRCSIVADNGRAGTSITIRIAGRGARHQDIAITVRDDDCVMTSVVLGTAAVKRTVKSWRALALLAWQRNAEQEIVTFGFDDRDRLVGRIRHPAAHLDAEELRVYLESLSAECDRFEYLLTGRDDF